MGNVTLPNALADGTTAYGSQVRANDDAIVTQVNGNIEDVNIATGAAINGSKLSNVAGLRVPTDRIEDDAATFDKVRDSATVNADRAIGVNHIRDDSVIARTVKNGSTGFSPGGILNISAMSTFDTGLLAAQVKVRSFEQSFAGVPATPQAGLVLTVWNDTNTGRLHLVVYNAHSSAVSLVGMTFTMKYVPAS